MAFTPIDLEAAVQTKLRGIPDLEHTTDGAVAFADLVSKKLLPKRLPAAFVIAGGLIGNGVRRAGGVSVPVTQTVSVVLVQSHAGDPSGEAARAAVWPLEWAVIDLLNGWTPAKGYEEFLFQEDRLQGLGGDGRTGAVACTLTFTTDWTIPRRRA